LFCKANHSSEESKSHHCSHLDNVVFSASSDLSSVIIISDASIRNNIAIFISHVHSFNDSLKKTLHHAINVTIMEVELFAIRCRINQATCIPGISHIIIITNVLHVVRKIFDSAIHPYQIQLIMILKDLQIFFNGHLNNIVEFWDCPSDKKCHLHAQVDKDIKKFDFILLYPNKISWGFSKKEEYDNIIKE